MVLTDVQGSGTLAEPRARVFHVCLLLIWAKVVWKERDLYINHGALGGTFERLLEVWPNLAV